MKIDVSMPLEDALDLSWQTLAECFDADELLMKQALIDKYFPAQDAQSPAAAPEPASSTQLDMANG